MRDFCSQAVLALTVYLERGQSAQEHFVRNEYDEAIEVLRWRNAAFHNFRFLDEEAKREGVDVGKDERISSIWSEIRKVDEKLKISLVDAREKTGAKVNKVRTTRKNITHYRSCNVNRSRFEHTA